jgi:hypothetical protein
VGVAYSCYEEAEAKGKYDDVPHKRSSLPRLLASVALRSSVERIALDQQPLTLIANDHEVPPCTYLFEVDATATL